jgi:hypothetical protein
MQLAIDVLTVVGFVLILIALLIIGFFFGMAAGGLVGAIAFPTYAFKIIRGHRSPEIEREEIV